MTSRTLRMLYRQIPQTSPCVAGCMDCCGPVPWSAEEFARVAADVPFGSRWMDVAGVQALESPVTGRCPFASPQGCRVYDRRPFMCRLFGSTKGAPLLACPHGVKARAPLSGSRADVLTHEYRQIDPAGPLS